MIGIVIVSHSAKLAEGVVELARGMGGADVRLKAAGGLDLPGQPLGTDPVFILSAIEEVYSEDGVLVLMDLGSSVLSAEMAVEMLPEEKRGQVILCEAPLVEGAVVAAVQARVGSSLLQAAAEARGSLTAKADHLKTSVPEAQPVQVVPEISSRDEEKEQIIQVNNLLGLHARPAARLVKIANRFSQTDIQVKNLTTGRGPANARSINAIMTLGVLKGHEIRISAAGEDAQAALAAVLALAADHFGDAEPPGPALAQPARMVTERWKSGSRPNFQGLPTSAGIAIGPVEVLQPVMPDISTHLIYRPWEEWEALQKSIQETRSQIMANLALAKKRTSAQTAQLFEAHLLFLEDGDLLEPIRAIIFTQKLNAAAAWHRTIQQRMEQYQKIGDPYLRERAKDLEDVGRQVLLNLLGLKLPAQQFEAPCILVAPDLTPAEITRLDPSQVLGICTALGGVLSHAMILARSLGIPAVAGLGIEISSVPRGALMILDGSSGDVWLNPPKNVLDEYSHLAAADNEMQIKAQEESRSPVVTRDGRRLEIAANIGSARDVHQALRSGAEGVGLFRTEFLFLDRQTAPGEEEQYQAYRAAAEALDGKSLIIRTLDAGGDKVLPYLNIAYEENPFLGLRGIRLCLDQPDLFKTQLRAILRVAAEFPVKVMFPMVATLSEWRRAKAFVEEARVEAEESRRGAPIKIETGIMVEIPAAALKADQFAAEVDFFSIGTNDLTQYTLAAERGNPRVAALSDPFHPAVLELVQRVVKAAHAQGKWAGACGEMAADPQAIPVLVGLGLDELSMNAGSIPRVKQIIRTLDYENVKALAASALSADSPGGVRKKFTSAII